MKSWVIITAIALAVLLIGYFSYIWKQQHKEPNLLRPGMPAPQFTLKNEQNELVSLKDFLGRRVLLYFYPKSDTPNCTKQACAIRDSNKLYNDNNIVVLAINYDTPEQHAAFKERYSLPFMLLSDEDKMVAKAYGAYHGVTKELFPARYTYLIDEKGDVVSVMTEGTVDVNAQAIIALFKAEK